MPSSLGIVAGFGSIGRRHAAALAPQVERLAILNRGAAVREQAQMLYPDALVCASLDELLQLAPIPGDSVAIIATLAASHCPLLLQLIESGVRRVLCEKPLASSLADAAAMARAAESAGAVLALNHTLRHARLVQALRTLSMQNELGPVHSVVVAGGAACLATNGLHWLDFTTELFASEPVSVRGNAYSDTINPRSPELVYFGGTAVWQYSHGRQLTLSFSNGSSIFPQARLYYRNATATVTYRSLDGDDRLWATVARRPAEAVTRFPAVTRTGLPSDSVFEGVLPGTHSFTEGLRAAQAELLNGNSPSAPATVGVASVGALFGALAAGEEGCAISLPLPLTGNHASRHWPIS